MPGPMQSIEPDNWGAGAAVVNNGNNNQLDFQANTWARARLVTTSGLVVEPVTTRKPDGAGRRVSMALRVRGTNFQATDSTGATRHPNRIGSHRAGPREL